MLQRGLVVWNLADFENNILIKISNTAKGKESK